MCYFLLLSCINFTLQLECKEAKEMMDQNKKKKKTTMKIQIKWTIKNVLIFKKWIRMNYEPDPPPFFHTPPPTPTHKSS